MRMMRSMSFCSSKVMEDNCASIFRLISLVSGCFCGTSSTEPDQFIKRYVQRSGDTVQRFNRRIAQTAFDLSQVCSVQIGFER